MLTVDLVAIVFIVIMLAIWLAAACLAIAFGLRANRRAAWAEAEVVRLQALLGAAPALPLVVASDGSLATGERLADWLGLPRPPHSLAELTGADGTGIAAEEVALLAADVTGALKAGRSFSRSLHVRGSDRVLLARGRPASRALGGGAALWLFDLTDSEHEIGRLRAEALRVTTALESLLSLIEAAPFPMWHRGPDLKLALVNSAYVRAVEAENAEQAVSRGLELIDSADGRNPLLSAAAARDTGTISTRTVPATISGERRTMRVVDVPLGASGVAGYAVDIEEMEQVRAELGRFREAQREMFDRLSAGVAQFGADRSLIFYNAHFLRMFAIKPEWLADAPEFDRVLERMRETQHLPESRDFPSWKAERRGWFNAAANAIEESWTLPGGIHLRVVAQPLPDGGLLLIFEDRTEHVQLAGARDTLLRVRTATFDNLFEAIGVFAADGRLHIWNSRFREIWGLTELELSQQMRVDMLVEVVAQKLANPSRARLIRELVRIATVERQPRSGRIALADGRHFEFAVVPLPDGNALFTLLDITASRGIEAALRERAEALEEADKLKTAFVANMSYELRVPLTSIAGFAEMLDAGYAGTLDPTAQEYVKAILTSVGRLGALIEDVLDLTQGAAGNLPLTEAEIDVRALIVEAVEAASVAADERPLTLAVDLADDAGVVLGDRRRLRQVLDHLLANAISYTPPHGRVLLQAKVEADEVVWIVSDNGEGMDVVQRERIFDQFPRIDQVRGKGNSAIGIGLPLTRQLVEAHGGSIVLESEVGEGTTIVIRLRRKTL